MQYRNDTTRALVRSRYRTEDGKPLELPDGQNLIFDCIFGRTYPRVQCISYTQYGKSLTVGIGALERASNFPDKIAIVAPSNKKAKIIMGYCIGHIFDNEYTARKFQIGPGESRDRIRRERSKNRLTFRLSNGAIGEIFVVSAEAKRTKDLLDALMGFGAQTVILDESSLIEDVQYAGIKRMVGGYAGVGQENFLFEIGNPFRRNHFLRTWRGERYFKIFIDYQQGLREGRLTKEFVEEMRQEAMFDILYACTFPPEDAIDSDGYTGLVTERDLDNAYRPTVSLIGDLRLGVDPAGEGANYSVVVARGKNGAKVLYREHQPSTTAFAAVVIDAIRATKVKGKQVYIDRVGIGKGVFDMVSDTQEGRGCVGVAAGEKPSTPAAQKEFVNRRAEMFWGVKQWLRVSELQKHEGWEDLADVRYKIHHDRKVEIKPKDKMLKDGIQSPDVADALSLTFYEPETAAVKEYKEPEVKELYPGIGG